jgi:Tol biopolymer transport system component/C-terminal processing protease CtpA/Prc
MFTPSDYPLDFLKTLFLQMLRRLVLPTLLAAVALPMLAQPAAVPQGSPDRPLWMRYPAISPDGGQIAFSFEGGLWVVPASGGKARLLVGTGHHAYQPVWSPDAKHIAYASDVYGNFDVFVVSAEGGASRRLTTHSAPEVPIAFTPDGRDVLFSAQRMDARTSVQFPVRGMSELYKVSAQGGRRPVQLFSSPALSGQLDKAGQRLLYEDWKGYESDWRKHHVSPVARDIWLYELKAGKHRRLTTFGGEDRNPVWSPDEQSVYYLSERSGTFNVWRMPVTQPDAAVQLTGFERNPVRFLSIARDGTLAFGWDGELWTLPPGAIEPRRVPIEIATETRASRIENLTQTRGATEIALSPDGQEVAFVIRGEIFVASVEFGDTRRITNTPEQERSVSFSPDGRRLLFAGEREGSWNLYEASLHGSKKDAPQFFNAAQVDVKTLLKNGKENFQPRYSPDGKEVAYLENRNTIKVLNLASGQSRVVMPAEVTYSYSDGDQWFDWSPDGRYLLASFLDRQRWSSEVGLVDAQGKSPLVNLTKSGYEDQRPLWAHAGKMMIWSSDRMGLHGNSGSAQVDIFGMFFTREAFDRFRLDKAAYAQLVKEEEDEKKASDEAKKAAAEKAAAKPAAGTDDKARPSEPVKVEMEGIENRIVRLTPNSGNIRAAVMTHDGEALIYLVQSVDSFEVWINRPRDEDLKRVAIFPAEKSERFDPPPASLLLDAKGENALVLADGAIQKFKVPKGGAAGDGSAGGGLKLEPVKFSAELRLDRIAERAYLFDHVWRQTREKLYTADMGGVDWAYYRGVYERFLPYMADNRDFAEMLSEMLGELNVSHTGAGYIPSDKEGDATAALGAHFDEGYTGEGVKVTEVIEGGPLDVARAGVRLGMVIESIDGVRIAAGAEFDSMLNRKAGKRIAISVLDPPGNRRLETTVKPITLREQNELLYRRWVKTQRETVDRLSAGKVGYVHVRGMDDESYRDVFAEILGRHSAKQALILDTRFNGGGDLHDALATLLSGQRYLEFVPRGQSLGWDPTSRWTKPSIVLISESNYSDAHLFPWTYHFLKIGKLLGMPVAGTGTAVWWETLQDPTLYFGIPMVGFRDANGRYMEHGAVEPDIRVSNDPGRLEAGQDEQLEAAVKALLSP